MRRQPNKGMAIILVLGLLAITLAASYAMLRGQATTNQLAVNSSRALDARAAARSGLAAALRKMGEDGWAGVGTPFSANVTNNTWYEVSYATGDTKLTSGDALYSEYPFRVTITSTGYASDPTNSAVRASHVSRCIAQLVRRAMPAEPANWTTLRSNSLYQWSNNNTYIQFPLRISGSATVLGKAVLCNEYPENSGARNEYLEDLKNRIAGGKPDHRPFASPLTIALSRQDSTGLAHLQTHLGLTLTDTTASTANPLTHPGAVQTYRLYTGGKEYTIPVLQTLYGSTIQNLTLAPDPVNNPLGVFRSSGALSIQNNVTITGTLITADSSPEVQIYGTSVVIQGANLPALSGSSQVYQLPTALVSDDLKINSGATAQLKGFVMVWDEFELKQSSSSTTFALTGNLVTSRFTTKGRTSWVLNSGTWNVWHALYEWALDDDEDDDYEAYFPDYMQHWAGFTVQPTLTLSPNSSGVLPHWHDWTQPVYQKNTALGDTGLKWEVIRWEEGE